MKRIAVLGAGAWGTSIATVLAARLEVVLWARDPAQAEALARTRRNARYLPGIEIPSGVKITTSLKETAHCGLLLAATPVSGLRDILNSIDKEAPLVWLCKGFEQDTGLLPHQIVEQALGAGARCGALSGPSFAEEVARGLPAAVVAASRSTRFAREVQALFSTERFRVYRSADVAGVEIAGAAKNVVAVAAGICDGLGLGDSAKAALITRGAVEIARLGEALGARASTFHGLAGVGDLIVTCASRHGRNRAVGERLGRGEGLAEILASTEMVAEGVPTARALVRLARRAGVEMPIAEEVHRVLFRGKEPRRALTDLMLRAPKSE